MYTISCIHKIYFVSLCSRKYLTFSGRFPHYWQVKYQNDKKKNPERRKIFQTFVIDVAS